MATRGRGQRLLCAAAVAVLCLSASPARAEYVLGNGFNLTENTGLLTTGYTVYLVESPGIETLRPYVELAAAEIQSITGRTVTVQEETVLPPVPVVDVRDKGEIFVEVNAVADNCSMNSDVWVGCTETSKDFCADCARTDVQYVLSALVTIHPYELTRTAHDQQHVVFHEMGHAFGLFHYNTVFEGEKQLMDSNEHIQVSFQSGDRNGLIYQKNRGTA